MPSVTSQSLLPRRRLAITQGPAAPAPDPLMPALPTLPRPIAHPSGRWRRQMASVSVRAPVAPLPPAPQWPAMPLAPDVFEPAPPASGHYCPAPHVPKGITPKTRRHFVHGPSAKLCPGFVSPALKARTQAALAEMSVEARTVAIEHIYTLCKNLAGTDAPAHVPQILHSFWDVIPPRRLDAIALCERWITPDMKIALRQRVVACICSYPPQYFGALHQAFDAFVRPGLSDGVRVQMLERLTHDMLPKELEALRLQCMPIVAQLAADAGEIAGLVIYLARFNRRPDKPVDVDESDDEETDYGLQMLFGYDEDDACCPLTDATIEAERLEDAADAPPEGYESAEDRLAREARIEARRLVRQTRDYNRENVMQSGRSQSAKKAITALRRQVHNPLDMLLSLKIVELYLRNIAACPALQIGRLSAMRGGATEIANAIRVVTGDKQGRSMVVHTRHGYASIRTDFSKALVFNEIWSMVQDAPMGMGELAGLVWHAIATWSNPLETPEEIEQTKELLRYSFVLNLAGNIEDDGHQVCNTGVCQRLVTSLQGYYGIKMDLVSPESLLNELARDFALTQGDEDAPPEMTAAFYESAIKQAELYFSKEPQSMQVFQMHLQEYLNQSEMYYEPLT